MFFHLNVQRLIVIEPFVSVVYYVSQLNIYDIRELLQILKVRNQSLVFFPHIFPSKMFPIRMLCLIKCFVFLLNICFIKILFSPTSCNTFSFKFLSIHNVLPIFLQIHISFVPKRFVSYFLIAQAV